YNCAQGATAVRLSLDIDPDGATTGVFTFSALPENPHVPSGAYRLRGTTTARSGVITVEVDGDSWIDQPPGYVMVGINASSDPARRNLSGRITNGSCGAIDVDRRD